MHFAEFAEPFQTSRSIGLFSFQGQRKSALTFNNQSNSTASVSSDQESFRAPVTVVYNYAIHLLRHSMPFENVLFAAVFDNLPSNEEMRLRTLVNLFSGLLNKTCNTKQVYFISTAIKYKTEWVCEE